MFWRNWMLRGEYRYADFGTITNTGSRTCPGGCGMGTTGNMVTHDVKMRTHTALLGLAYKFDWGGPVIAKF